MGNERFVLYLLLKKLLVTETTEGLVLEDSQVTASNSSFLMSIWSKPGGEAVVIL